MRPIEGGCQGAAQDSLQPDLASQAIQPLHEPPARPGRPLCGRARPFFSTLPVAAIRYPKIGGAGMEFQDFQIGPIGDLMTEDNVGWDFTQGRRL